MDSVPIVALNYNNARFRFFFTIQCQYYSGKAYKFMIFTTVSLLLANLRNVYSESTFNWRWRNFGMYIYIMGRKVLKPSENSLTRHRRGINIHYISETKGLLKMSIAIVYIRRSKLSSLGGHNRGYI